MTHTLSRTLFAVVALTLGFSLHAADKKGEGKLSGNDRNFVTTAAEKS